MISSSGITMLFQNLFKTYLFITFQLIVLIDQLMCIKVVLWRKSFLNGKRALLLTIIVISIFVLTNFHLNISLTYSSNENFTVIEYLRSSDTFKFWIKVNFIESIFFSITIFIFQGKLYNILLHSFFCLDNSNNIFILRIQK
jgi:hypothetical protein